MNASLRPLIIAVVHQHGVRRLGNRLRKPLNSLEQRWLYGCRRLDFDGHPFMSAGYDQIDFIAVAVPVEQQALASSLIEKILHYLDHNQILIQHPAQRMRAELSRFGDADEVSRQSDVAEIELGGFYQSFGDVLEKGRQTEGQIACLQKGQPFSGRGLGNAGISTMAVRPARDWLRVLRTLRFWLPVRTKVPSNPGSSTSPWI